MKGKACMSLAPATGKKRCVIFLPAAVLCVVLWVCCGCCVVGLMCVRSGSCVCVCVLCVMGSLRVCVWALLLCVACF